MFVIMALSYPLSRVGSVYLANVGDGFVKKGPLAGSAVVVIVLWPLLYFVLQSLWKKIRSKQAESEEGIRISVDEFGNPVANRSGMFAKNLGGALFGLGRGAILYAGVLYLLLILVPSTMYKDGRGTVIVHPKSVTLRWLRNTDPVLVRMDQVTRGLQTIRGIQRHTRVRRNYRKSSIAQSLYRSPEVKKLRKNSKLLSRASSKTQGRRDSTLLLWLKSYQYAVFDTKTAKALHTLNVEVNR